MTPLILIRFLRRSETPKPVDNYCYSNFCHLGQSRNDPCVLYKPQKQSLRILSLRSQRDGHNWVTELKDIKLINSVAAAAKSLQPCPTVQLHRRQPTRLHRPWDSPGKNTGVGCHFLLQCVKVKVKPLSCVQLLATPWNAAYQAPLCPWDFPGKSTGVGCHCLLRNSVATQSRRKTPT